MKRLHGYERLEDNFIANDNLVTNGTQFVERLHNEPGALATRVVEIHSHGIFLDMCWQFLVNGQIFVAFEV